MHENFHANMTQLRGPMRELHLHLMTRFRAKVSLMSKMAAMLPSSQDLIVSSESELKGNKEGNAEGSQEEGDVVVTRVDEPKEVLDEQIVVKVEKDGSEKFVKKKINTKKSQGGRRNPNWTEDQVTALRQFINKHYDILYGNVSSTLTMDDKRRKWEEGNPCRKN